MKKFVLAAVAALALAAMAAPAAMAGSYVGADAQVNLSNQQVSVVSLNADSVTTTPGFYVGPFFVPTGPAVTTGGTISGVTGSASAAGNVESINAGWGDFVAAGSLQVNGLNSQTAVLTATADESITGSKLSTVAIGNEFDVTGTGTVFDATAQFNGLNSQTAVTTVSAPTVGGVDASASAAGNVKNLSGQFVADLGVQVNGLNSQTAVTTVSGLTLGGGSASASTLGNSISVK